MAVARPVRVIGAIVIFFSLVVFIKVFNSSSASLPSFQGVRNTLTGHSGSNVPTGEVLNNEPGGKWHDPDKDLIDEPPAPLRRVKGNNYAADNPNSDRVNATIIALVRNEELAPLLMSMRDLESTFNGKFNYPYTFFNDEPFTTLFKDSVRKQTKAEVRFEQIPSHHWGTPPWINQELYEESARMLLEQNIQYADKISYHQMCRWNSGVFQHHKALADMQYYWRFEPNTHFFCDIDYDVFGFMVDHNKTYGFTINLYDAPQTIETLWPETQKFLAQPENKKLVNPNSALSWLTDSRHRPEHNKMANGYSTCHFWSNFEIGSLDFWRSEGYTRYFEHLDRAGGFFYERWGDAPVHSVALGLFEDKSKIHWFRDIGYQHIPFFNCPNRPAGKCRGCNTAQFTDGEDWLYKEDCRPSYFEHVGLGVWDDAEKL